MSAVTVVLPVGVDAQSAGQQRLLFLQRAVAAGEEVGELARLHDENRRLNSELRMLKDRFGEAPARKRYTPMQRLRVLWHMAYYVLRKYSSARQDSDLYSLDSESGPGLLPAASHHSGTKAQGPLSDFEQTRTSTRVTNADLT